LWEKKKALNIGAPLCFWGFGKPDCPRAGGASKKKKNKKKKPPKPPNINPTQHKNNFPPGSGPSLPPTRTGFG